MQYLPPLVFSSVSLLDPALTAVLSYLFGIERWPSLWSWLGGITVIVGVAIISIAEQRQHDQQRHAKEDHSASASARNAEEEDMDRSVHRLLQEQHRSDVEVEQDEENAIEGEVEWHYSQNKATMEDRLARFQSAMTSSVNSNTPSQPVAAAAVADSKITVTTPVSASAFTLEDAEDIEERGGSAAECDEGPEEDGDSSNGFPELKEP